MAHVKNKLRVVEFYSGIGGFHYALNDSGLDHDFVAALDINTTANSVYKFNFPNAKLIQRNIESLSIAEVNKLAPDLIWMSPPCQPFTRNGLKKDSDDFRTVSFIHILEILKNVKNKPRFILMENVKGFETSNSHKLLTDTLYDLHYNLKEFLLCPRAIGIPNSRLRYYLIAELNLDGCVLEKQLEINLKLPDNSSHLPCESLENFLENKPSDYFIPFYVDDSHINKYLTVMDIVKSSDTHSCCFTKSYGRYAIGTGSILQLNKENSRLRYFTPREVANIMGFPAKFDFPADLTSRQRYRLLGNSLNVKIVTKLLQLITPPNKQNH